MFDFGAIKVTLLETIRDLFNAKWVKNSDNELGFRILGMNFWYHQNSVPVIDLLPHKEIKHKEFGDSILAKTDNILDTYFDCKIDGKRILEIIGNSRKVEITEYDKDIITIIKDSDKYGMYP